MVWLGFGSLTSWMPQFVKSSKPYSVVAHAVPGVAYTTANIAGPGVIRHVSGPHRIGFGEAAGGRSERLDAFDEVARGAGLETAYSDDVQTLLWRKFVVLASGAGVCTLARLPVGAMRAGPCASDSGGGMRPRYSSHEFAIARSIDFRDYPRPGSAIEMTDLPYRKEV